MAKSFNHKNHWQFQQLKKLQSQQNKDTKDVAYKSSTALSPAGYAAMTQAPADITGMPSLQAFPKETSTEPIVALRVWNVEKRGGKPYLRSTFKTNFIWPYRKALEQDITADAGIHAVKPKKDWHDILMQAFGYNPFADFGPKTATQLAQYYKAPVMGEVYLWGRVQEHAYGYLAQFAYPKRLWVSPKMDVLTWMELEYEYGVPCDTHESLDPANWRDLTDGFGFPPPVLHHYATP